MYGAAVGLIMIAAGLAIDAIGALAQTPTGGGDLAPLVSGGGAITAVGGIVYIARLMATGKLVARAPADVETQLLELVRRGVEREVAADKREEELFILLRTRAQAPRGRT